MDSIAAQLAALADPAYRAFQVKLIPTVAPETVLGVRTPDLRRFARALARDRTEEAMGFLHRLPHATYDENNLHGELIGLLSRDADDAFELLDVFLPYVDNWAT